MIKSINKYINLSILLSILFALCGVILIVWPKASLDTIGYILGAFLLVYGITNFIDSFTISPIFCLIEMISSVLSIVIGVAVFLNPNIMENLLPILLGIFFIISGAFKARISYIIKSADDYLLPIITSILMILCGIILIVYPQDSAIAVAILTGVIMLIYGISDVIDMIVFKSNVKSIEKYFDKLIK